MESSTYREECKSFAYIEINGGSICFMLPQTPNNYSYVIIIRAGTFVTSSPSDNVETVNAVPGLPSGACQHPKEELLKSIFSNAVIYDVGVKMCMDFSKPLIQDIVLIMRPNVSQISCTSNALLFRNPEELYNYFHPQLMIGAPLGLGLNSPMIEFKSQENRQMLPTTSRSEYIMPTNKSIECTNTNNEQKCTTINTRSFEIKLCFNK